MELNKEFAVYEYRRNVFVLAHPELVVVAGRTLLDEGAVVCGDVTVVTVLLQHVDLGLNLLLFLLGDVHHLYSSQLSCLHMAPLGETERIKITQSRCVIY